MRTRRHAGIIECGEEEASRGTIRSGAVQDKSSRAWRGERARERGRDGEKERGEGSRTGVSAARKRGKPRARIASAGREGGRKKENEGRGERSEDVEGRGNREADYGARSVPQLSPSRCYDCTVCSFGVWHGGAALMKGVY